MNKDDLKRYSVIVEGGSGCLFQPMTDAYTYVLTAKHLFFDKKTDEQGQDYNVQKTDGTNIEISRFIQIPIGWDEKVIPFELQEGETYFPHKDADIAILKIEPAIEGFEKISIEEIFKEPDKYELCGFPSNVRDTRDYTTHKLENFISSNGYFHSARLFGTLRQDDIEGMSGCGILSIFNDNISIIGIQSKMGNQIFPAGEIGFVQIKYFNEIVEYVDYKEKLSKLFPPYMKNFDFLLEDCFALEVDEIDETKIQGARTILRNKAFEITQSDITPIGIKEFFNERLLINEKELSCLSHKKVWISWLEFLVIMNMMKYEELNSDMLSELFNSYRLKFINTDDWTGIFRTDLLKSDYIGLKENSTVVVNTRNSPKTTMNLHFPKGRMIDIGVVYEKRGFRTDMGLDPYTSFNFVHLDFFKTKCIIEKLDQYKNLSEPELIEKIKSEYNELFS